MKRIKLKRICPNGHTYFKSSDCPTCPTCESKRKPESGFLSLVSAPARRALQNAKINSLHQLANYTSNEILNLHGIGPSSIPKLNQAL